MNWYTRLKMVPRIVLPVALVMFICFGGLAWVIQQRSEATVTQMAKSELIALGNQYGNYVQAFMEVGLDTALAQADMLGHMKSSNIPLTRETVMMMHQGVELANTDIAASGSIWAPNAFDGRDAEFRNAPGSEADGRFAPYAVGDSPIITVDDYDNADYYLVPMKSGQAFVSDPYVYPVNGQDVLMTTASAPVIVKDAAGKGSVAGVVTVDIAMDTITQVVAKAKAYTTGYGGLLSRSGVIISHPQKNLIGKNFFDLGRSADAAKLRAAMEKKESYFEVRPNGEMCYYQPIEFRRSGEVWYFAISAPGNEVLAAAVELGNLTIALCLGVLVLLILLIYVVVRASIKPMAYIAGVAEEIAQGNLKVNIRTDNLGGEVLMLGNSMRDMVESLVSNINKAEVLSQDAHQQAAKAQQAMHDAEAAGLEARAKSENLLKAADQLEQVAQVLSSASAQLSAQIEQSERGASEQAARVAETATAMEEMNSTVLEVARNASAAAEVSAGTRQKAEAGAQVVQQAVVAIGGVQAQSLALRADMETLGEHAQSINRIMNVISDIADQTNLLALNAAIEAARAGDAGRGFAVVADEVRKLAEKTMASTTDVGNAIRAIQQSAEKNMAQVDSAVQSIESVTGLAGQSGAALSEIVSLVDATADQVRAIATASEEQSSTSDEINRSITQVNSIAGETARAMEESARAVSELAQQAQVLMTLIDEMKKG